MDLAARYRPRRGPAASHENPASCSLLMTSIVLASLLRRAEPPAQRRRSLIAAQRQRRAAAQHRFGLGGRPAVLVVEHAAPAAARAARGCPCWRAPGRGSPAARRGRGPAAPRCRRSAVERGQHLGQAVGAPDQRQRAGGMQQPRRGIDPVGEQRRRAAACAARRPRIGRDVLPRRIVERRVHQHAIGRCRAQCRAAANASAGAATSSVTARTRSPSPLRAIFSAASAASSGSISTSVTSTSGDAHRQRQAGRADARAEIDRLVAGPRAGRRRQQDRVVADAVAAPLLRQPQPAAEHGVVGQSPASGRAGIAAAARGRGRRPPAAGARSS